MGKESIFAVSNIQNRQTEACQRAGNFFDCSTANYSGFVPPCGTVMEPQPILVLDNGKGKAVFLLPVMPKLSNMATQITPARTGRTIPERKPRVSYKHKFMVEMDCKNEAYAFILQMGLLDEFARFSRSLSQGDDPHALCISILSNQKTNLNQL